MASGRIVRIERLEERVVRLLQEEGNSAKSSHAREATADVFTWVTHSTETFNEHWQEERRPSPHEKFPRYPYFQDIFDLLDLEPITWIEKSRDLIISWACVAYLTRHRRTVRSRRHSIRIRRVIRDGEDAADVVGRINGNAGTNFCILGFRPQLIGHSESKSSDDGRDNAGLTSSTRSQRRIARFGGCAVFHPIDTENMSSRFFGPPTIYIGRKAMWNRGGLCYSNQQGFLFRSPRSSRWQPLTSPGNFPEC